jgi:SAM-dependent methyltransferase
MQRSAQLAGFYEQTYTSDPAEAGRYARWRAFSAVGKAAHTITLCERAGLKPRSTLDVGCGDGALLCELRRRAFGGRLEGVEIAPAAVEIARARPEIDAVALYDGERLPFAEDARKPDAHEPDARALDVRGPAAYDLGILSHVLEHVHDPAQLLREVTRVCAAVVVEVPLEDNLSARRLSKRGHAAEVGHLQRLSRSAMRAIVARAGLRVADELEDALPRRAQTFFTQGPTAKAGASLKWAVRTGLHGAAPPLARRLFTVHYACLCLPVDALPRVR